VTLVNCAEQLLAADRNAKSPAKVIEASPRDFSREPFIRLCSAGGLSLKLSWIDKVEICVV